ncbi:hypothetical protein D3C85_1404810 [compost metagenome]
MIDHQAPGDGRQVAPGFAHGAQAVTGIVGAEHADEHILHQVGGQVLAFHPRAQPAGQPAVMSPVEVADLLTQGGVGIGHGDSKSK